MFVALATAAKRGLTPAPLWIPPTPQNQTILHLSLKCEHKRHESASMPQHGLLDSLRFLFRIIYLSDKFRFDLRGDERPTKIYGIFLNSGAGPKGERQEA